MGTPEFENLLASMKIVASGRGDDTNLAQVAINYNRAKNTIQFPVLEIASSSIELCIIGLDHELG